jgi:hypothetical protein
MQSSYSQHVIKPNLAYNFLGVAIRLAYSIGLNRSSVAVAYDETAWPGVGKVVITEMCKRIWWQVLLHRLFAVSNGEMYTLEVEIALDSGRPICIRNSDIDVEWPIECDDKVRLCHIRILTIRKLKSMPKRLWWPKMDHQRCPIWPLYLGFQGSSDEC